MLYSGNLFIILFFIYGISFFTLGVIALQHNIPKETSFPLLKAINYLGLFGIIHACVEWLIMFAIADLFPEEKLDILMTAVVLNAISFTMLLYFSIKVIDYKNRGSQLLEWLPWIVFVVWVVSYGGALINNGEFSFKISLDYDTLCRYFIGLPAAIITSMALFYNAGALKVMKLKKAAIKFKLLAVAFLSYGVFAGVLVNKRNFFPANIINKQIFLDIIGFPVELGRMLSAVFITILFIGIIDIFRLESDLIMQSLAQERVASQERRRLGRDLHDGIIQDLFASGLQIESLVMENEVEVLHNGLRNVKSDLNNAIQRIREFIETISAKQMEMDQFKIQLYSSVDSFKKISKATISLDYQIPDITLRYISCDKLTQIYYIIQEAISNSVKHSTSSHINIKIGHDLRVVIVEIKDNGKGFDLRTARSTRKFGLNSMQERAASVGGSLSINSSTSGTNITLLVPWEEGINE